MSDDWNLDEKAEWPANPKHLIRFLRITWRNRHKLSDMPWPIYLHIIWKVAAVSCRYAETTPWKTEGKSLDDKLLANSLKHWLTEEG
ncbi:MAG TPA: hypothetical protein VMW24_24995 [Sedimentisphaerales bacterium]|nr:hypothetical protein [Sedimentisphaerales bacterium]